MRLAVACRQLAPSLAAVRLVPPAGLCHPRVSHDTSNGQTPFTQGADVLPADTAVSACFLGRPLGLLDCVGPRLRGQCHCSLVLRVLLCHKFWFCCSLEWLSRCPSHLWYLSGAWLVALDLV